MNLEKIAAVFTKDLNRLADEIGSYKNEKELWVVMDGISNSGGNLALHILGNLQHYIGHVIGNSDYQRDRPAEFNSKNVHRAHLLSTIETTKSVIAQTLERFPKESMDDLYPLPGAFGLQETTNLQALVILCSHLNYHLGQINYHRRLQ